MGFRGVFREGVSAAARQHMRQKRPAAARGTARSGGRKQKRTTAKCAEERASGRGGQRARARTLPTRRPYASCTVSTWSTISCGDRLRAKPPLPVAQKVQRMGQPTCLLFWGLGFLGFVLVVLVVLGL